MRVVIRYRRKSALDTPADGLALNGVEPVAVEPTANSAATVHEARPVAIAEPEPPAVLVEPEVIAVPELVPPQPPPGPEPIAPEESVARETEYPGTPQMLAPKPAPLVAPTPSKPDTKPEKVRCPRCNSTDTWRFGRVKGIRLAMASLARGQWITCRGCGNRFLTRYYGPMEEKEDDD